MELVTTICLVILSGAALLAVLRLLRGSSLADRVVALENLLLVGVSAIAVGAVRSARGDFLNVLVVLALVSFVAPVTIARFMERRGVSG